MEDFSLQALVVSAQFRDGLFYSGTRRIQNPLICVEPLSRCCRTCSGWCHIPLLVLVYWFTALFHSSSYLLSLPECVCRSLYVTMSDYFGDAA